MHTTTGPLLTLALLTAVAGACAPATFTPTTFTAQLDVDAVRITVYGTEPAETCRGGTTYTMVANGTAHSADVFLEDVAIDDNTCGAEINVPLPSSRELIVTAGEGEAPWTVTFPDVDVDRAPQLDAAVLVRGERYEIEQAHVDEIEYVSVNMYRDGDSPGLPIEPDVSATSVSFVVPDEARDDNRLMINVTGLLELDCDGIGCADVPWFRDLDRTVGVTD